MKVIIPNFANPQIFNDFMIYKSYYNKFTELITDGTIISNNRSSYPRLSNTNTRGADASKQLYRYMKDIIGVDMPAPYGDNSATYMNICKMKNLRVLEFNNVPMLEAEEDHYFPYPYHEFIEFKSHFDLEEININMYNHLETHINGLVNMVEENPIEPENIQPTEEPNSQNVNSILAIMSVIELSAEDKLKLIHHLSQ
tara:strand:- start:217 stop:810 length:594 start_codon:yes stop_codon:yes gene_type:complete